MKTTKFLFAILFLACFVNAKSQTKKYLTVGVGRGIVSVERFNETNTYNLTGFSLMAISEKNYMAGIDVYLSPAKTIKHESRQWKSEIQIMDFYVGRRIKQGLYGIAGVNLCSSNVLSHKSTNPYDFQNKLYQTGVGLSLGALYDPNTNFTKRWCFKGMFSVAKHLKFSISVGYKFLEVQ